MYINRKWVAMFVILISIAAFYLSIPSLYYVFTPEFPIGPKLVQGAIFISVVAAVIWSNWAALNWVERGGATQETSTLQTAQSRASKRVEKILRDLNDDEYALLQTRLSQQQYDNQPDDHYQTNEPVLHTAKRKNS